VLDENTIIPKARLFLVDWDIFANPMARIKLDNVRRLIWEFHPPWQLLFVHNGTTFEKDVLQRVKDLGLPIYDEYDLSSLVMFSNRVELVYGALRVVDIAYVPKIRNLPVNFMLRSPRDDKQALEVVCYFANAMEPFTHGNYNRLLAIT